MNNFKSHQTVISCFHSAIDFEHENKNIEAYKKYAEGISIIGEALMNDTHSLHQAHVINIHKQLLKFAKKSTDRLLSLLDSFDSDIANLTNDGDSVNNNSLSTYQKLSETLPEIVTNTPSIPISIPDDIPGLYSPISFIEEDNKRIIRMYENRIESLLNPAAKSELLLELERRLAENNTLARKRYEDWETRRKALADECQKIAEEKFFIQEKIKSGTVNEKDFTKQNLYATCLQFHKEHSWAQENSCKLVENAENENSLKKILTSFIQNGSYPLSCMLKQVQRKTVNKLCKLHLSQISPDENEKNVLEEHLNNIVRDTKEDIFLLTTVMQALWESLNTEAGQLIIIDVLHHLFFPAVKPYFIHLLRIILHVEEETLLKCMQENLHKIGPYPSSLNSVVTKLHQLSLIHSPSTMMMTLVDILKSLIHVHCAELSDDEKLLSSVNTDNLMPKLIQLILLSNMSTLFAEVSFVENFMPARKALGVEGFAVTLFQSVLSYMYRNSHSIGSDIVQ